VVDITYYLRLTALLPALILGRMSNFTYKLNMSQYHDEKLKLIVEVLKDEFAPKRIFLFGSRSNGSSRSDSDYDFVIVVEKTDRTRIENMGIARQAIRSAVGVSADVFVYDQFEFDEWKNEFSSIPETALTMGQELSLG